MLFKKSRLAALLSVALMVCMMVAMLVVPASAATFDVEVRIAQVDRTLMVAGIYRTAQAELHEYESYEDLAMALGYSGTVQQVYASPDGNAVYLNLNNITGFIDKYNSTYTDTPIAVENFAIYKNSAGLDMYRIPAIGVVKDFMTTQTTTFTYNTTGALVDSLESGSLEGVLQQIIDVLPIAIPVLIGFIGLRKGISFLQSVLHSA